MGIHNTPALGRKIDSVYTKGQQELIERILKSLVSGDDGYRCISRAGTWDQGGGMKTCGCLFFGEPGPGKKYAWLFSGHHMTLRSDGDFRDGAAWGGPDVLRPFSQRLQCQERLLLPDQKCAGGLQGAGRQAVRRPSWQAARANGQRQSSSVNPTTPSRASAART